MMCKHLARQTLSGDIINISVGDPLVPFNVHIELLCDISPWFSSRVKYGSNAAPIPITIPYLNPDAFVELLNWAYGGTIFINESTPTSIGLARLWVLAEQCNVPELQNLVIKTFWTLGNEVIELETVQYVYNNTRQGSPLRRMIVRQWSHKASKEQFAAVSKELPRSFVEDCCLKLLSRPPPKSLPDFSYYYVPSIITLEDDASNPHEPKRWRVPNSPQPALPAPIASSSNSHPNDPPVAKRPRRN